MRVDHVQRPRSVLGPSRRAAPEATVQGTRGARERARAGWELVELDVDVLQTAQCCDLVAHEAAALGVGSVGEHVRDHERSHEPSTVALWNDGGGGKRSRRSIGCARFPGGRIGHPRRGC